MHAILFAAVLTFGTMKAPLTGIDIDRDVALVPATKADFARMKKYAAGGIEVYARSIFDEEDPSDVTLQAIVRNFRIDDAADVDRAPSTPRVSLVRPGIVRIDQDRTLMGANAYDEMMTTLIVDARRPKPRVVSVHSDSHMGGGACTGRANNGYPRTALSCSWDEGRDDFVCTDALLLNNPWNTRIGWKRFTLFGDDALERASDLRDPKELLTREHPNVVAGRGAVERVSISKSIDLFLIPPVGHTFVLEGWLVDRDKQRVVQLDTKVIAEPTEEPFMAYDMRDDGYTPDREPVTFRVLKPVNAAMTPIEVEDGSAHATFWLGYDGTIAQLLRVSTDAQEFTNCANEFSPPTATKIDGTHVHVDDDCSFNATIRWERGFVIEPPPECGAENSSRR